MVGVQAQALEHVGQPSRQADAVLAHAERTIPLSREVAVAGAVAVNIKRQNQQSSEHWAPANAHSNTNTSTASQIMCYL